MKNLKFFLIEKIITVLIFFSLFSCGMDDPLTVINPTLIGKGDLYGNGGEGIEQQNIVISDTAAWNELKTKMNAANNVTNSFTETEIDFSNYIILASFSEVRGSGGYSIEIKNVIENSCCILSTIKNTIPEGAAIAIMTQPYHIVKIPKTGKQVVFN